MRFALNAVAVLAGSLSLSQALELDVTDPASIKHAASAIAYGMMKYYTGNVTNTQETVGVLPWPYYWWEAGAMWGALLDYYHFTGDSTYNEVTTQALISQVGPLYDYMVPWHQKDEGNDDQAFWGFATMSAAEKGYPPPDAGGYSWVQLTENLWNTQVRRWDTTSCKGGLKWQIFPFNPGYDYKSSVANGAFFQLSARLARFTGNRTYAEWAEKSLQWSLDVGLISSNWQVFDGADDTIDCSQQDHILWTYTAGIYLYGAAIMYNYTNASPIWETRTQGFLSATGNFFSPYDNSTDVMYESACETVQKCNNDQKSFKAYLSRFMWASTLMAPFTVTAVTTLLQKSSIAAAQSCSGGSDGVTCGVHWYYGGWDGIYGVGQQLSALETIQGLLVAGSTPPLQSDQVNAATPDSAIAGPLQSSPSSSSNIPLPSNSSSGGIFLPSSAPSSSMASSSSDTMPLTSSSETSSSSEASASSNPTLSQIPPVPVETDVKFPVATAASPTTTKKSNAGKMSPITWLGIISAGVLHMSLP